MPRYRVRAEAPDSDEFRVTYVTADSPDAARAAVEAKERQLAATTYSPAELEKAAEGAKPGRPSFQQVIHDQAEPYEVVDVTARSQVKSESKVERRAS